MANEKGLNRGGTLGQEGDFDLDEKRREQGKQQGGISREPNLEKKEKTPDKKHEQPTHVVD